MSVQGFGKGTGFDSLATSGGGVSAPVQPPASTTEQVSVGGSPTAKTFGAFTDPDALIASYSAAMVNVIGTTAVSGTGLGPYTFSGSADGDSFTLKLNALNGGGQTLATAVHAVDIAAPSSTAQPPAPSTEVLSSGGDPVSYTFGAFTDPDSIIASYTASITNVVGSTSIASGSGLGPYAFANYMDGDNFLLLLEAKDSGGDTVATAIRAVYIAPSTGTEPGTGFQFLFATDAGVTIGTAGTLT